MKAYTDISQSKKLAEILPLKSADMRYTPFGDTHPWVWDGDIKLLEKDSVPCWSLAALLEVIYYPILIQEYDGKWSCIEFQEGEEVGGHETPVDACYEMIIKLHEQKLL